jgi:hypothetical protein
VGQPKKDNSVRDTKVLRTILALFQEGEVPSVRDVAEITGYTIPSTYVSFKSLWYSGRLVKASSIYFPPVVYVAMQQAASLELEATRDKTT